MDADGCAAIQRDSDNDGVNDLLDQCEGTPQGLQVNGVGCADIDGDGVFANVDACADSPSRWSVDANGCAVVQLPVGWASAPSLNGPMQVVPQFSFPTLNGTFNFPEPMDGTRCLLFHVQIHRFKRQQQRRDLGTKPRKIHPKSTPKYASFLRFI